VTSEPEYTVYAGHLCEVTTECTGGGCGVYGHEPGCGLQPIGPVEDLINEARATNKILAWCDQQDALSKGESMTTAAIRKIIKGETDGNEGN